MELRRLTAKVGGDLLTVEANVTGLAGFLLAKAATARARRARKDWYDIAFVLLHNDRGGTQQAGASLTTARAASSRFWRRRSSS